MLQALKLAKKPAEKKSFTGLQDTSGKKWFGFPGEITTRPRSTVIFTSACHTDDPGSIPGGSIFGDIRHRNSHSQTTHGTNFLVTALRRGGLAAESGPLWGGSFIWKGLTHAGPTAHPHDGIRGFVFWVPFSFFALGPRP